VIRFLADENFPLPSVHRLRSKGYAVASIAEDSPGITDLEVLARADRERRVVLTFDRDFGELLYRHNLQYKQLVGVIYLRFHPTTPTEAAEIVLAELHKPGFTIRRSYLIVERHQVRHRPLP
jgi:predicted nuclease of predicted toxin-antitoxin system